MNSAMYIFYHCTFIIIHDAADASAEIALRIKPRRSVGQLVVMSEVQVVAELVGQAL